MFLIFFDFKKDYVVSYGMFFFINPLPGGRIFVVFSSSSCVFFFHQMVGQNLMSADEVHFNLFGHLFTSKAVIKLKKTVSINSCATYYAQPSNEKTMRFKDIKLKYI